MPLRVASREHIRRPAHDQPMPLPRLPAKDWSVRGRRRDFRDDSGRHRRGSQGFRARWTGRAQNSLPLLPVLRNIVVLGWRFPARLVRRRCRRIRGPDISAAFGICLRRIETCLGSASRWDEACPTWARLVSGKGRRRAARRLVPAPSWLRSRVLQNLISSPRPTNSTYRCRSMGATLYCRRRKRQTWFGKPKSFRKRKLCPCLVHEFPSTNVGRRSSVRCSSVWFSKRRTAPVERPKGVVHAQPPLGAL